ncbi:uncharacterized protein LOC141641431 [Silene latifolia]|uniref:uncharacterized protein LOC141641431 n=1 Tax=Silene latifolia TaxID=37657 RepID=UPI003D781A06
MRKLEAKWSIKGNLKLTDLGCSYYASRVSSKQDYEHVITQEPWMIDGHYLTIRRWVPNFIPTEDKLQFLTAWVYITNLPVEYFNEAFLKKVGSKIGTVVRIDKNTAVAERCQFTRLSVEINIAKPLLSKFRMKGKVYHIQYEGLRIICFSCGRLGHMSESCPKSSSPIEKDTDILTEEQLLTELSPDTFLAESEINIMAEDSPAFGDWIMVKKPSRRRTQPNSNADSALIFNFGKNNNHGSRFDLLSNITHNRPDSDTVITHNPLTIAPASQSKLNRNIINSKAYKNNNTTIIQ